CAYHPVGHAGERGDGSAGGYAGGKEEAARGSVEGEHLSQCRECHGDVSFRQTLLPESGKENDYLAGNGGPPRVGYDEAMTRSNLGQQLREWRTRRRRSQLDLALDCGISSRHLSFIETGRARPSPQTLLRIAETLEVPPRAQNALLMSGGYAPRYPETPFDAEAVAPVRDAVGRLLEAYSPFPALAVDRLWNVVAANAPLMSLLSGVPAELLSPAPNALRLAMHPEGIAPRIANFGEWSGHLMHRLERQIELTADPELEALREEMLGYLERRPAQRREPQPHELAVPLQLDLPEGRLSLLSTMTVFGSPVDVTLSELAIEAFFPADEASAEILQGVAGGGKDPSSKLR